MAKKSMDLVAKGRIYGLVDAVRNLIAMLHDDLQEADGLASEDMMEICSFLRETSTDIFRFVDDVISKAK